MVAEVGGEVVWVVWEEFLVVGDPLEGADGNDVEVEG